MNDPHTQRDLGNVTPEGVSASCESADLDNGRQWLEAAEEHWTQGRNDAAYAAAVIGNGFIGLAHTTASLGSMRDLKRRQEAMLDALVADEPTLGAAIARERQVAEESRSRDDEPVREPEHSADCEGCDGPGVVPCLADEVRDGLAYRDGFPIKDLRPEARRG
jgi:hypothetical protein